MAGRAPRVRARGGRARRGNVLLQYGAATTAVILAVSLALGAILVWEIRDYQIKSHVQLFPEMLRVSFWNDPSLLAFLRGPPEAEPDRPLEGRLRSLLELGGVFRVKLWDPDGRIRWSDEPDLIGQSFPDREKFARALGGKTVYEVTEPNEAENAFEMGRGVVLEIYVPLVIAGTVAGIIELYEANAALEGEIARNNAIVWAIVGAAGLVLYLLLFALFYRAYAAQKSDALRIKRTQDVTIYALALQAELRDSSTGHHLERTSAYSRILAEEMARDRSLRPYLVPEYIEDLARSAPLHDVGKVGVPDAILRKPGRLDEAETEEMRKHCGYGAELLRKAEARLEFRSFLAIAIQVAAHHHERWDGKGYPAGLAAAAIPLSARIMAVADSYDAMRSRRSYKEPYPHGRCVEILRAESGAQFDPAVISAFLAREADIAEIAARLGE